MTSLATWINLLDLDPALGAALEPTELRQVKERATAPTAVLPRGPLRAETARLERGGLGLLVVEGLLARRLRIGDRRSVELLGPGDLLGPGAARDEAGLLRADESWAALEPTRVAVLDCLFQQRTARWPELHAALLDRAVARADSLTLRLALAQVPRLGDRLELVLWHLAERWGRVEPRGVAVSLRLSHQLLAELVCAQRPSVTRALKELARDDRIVPLPAGGWLLRGCPPTVGNDAHRVIAAPVTRLTAPAALPSAAAART